MAQPRLKLVNYLSEKHSPSDSVEKINDLFFVLFILAKGEEQNIAITTGTLMKTVFTTKIDLSNTIKFWHTGFHPYKKGPFTKTFYSYIENLEKNGLMKKDGANLSLTAKGGGVIFPLIEGLRNTNNDCLVIEKSIEQNLKECRNFLKKVKELHKEKMIIETEAGDNIMVMDDVINKLPGSYNKIIESVNDTKKKFELPDRIINKLLEKLTNVEPEEEPSRYDEIVICNPNQLINLLQ